MGHGQSGSRQAGRTLMVLGHGSHLNADSASAVRQHAGAVRARGLYEQVIEGYWKEEPSLRGLLRLARYCDVTIVPLFVSEGYFTGTVLPRELGLKWRGPVPPGGLVEEVDGYRVHYTRPYGVHPAMAGVILARAAEVCPHWTPQQTALVVLGHGTGRDAQSQQAIEQAAAALRLGGHFAEVQALYLDQEPRVEHWQTRLSAPNVVIVPFFASEGWHTQETIPQDLGLSGPVTHLGGRTVYYSPPVGTHPDVTDVVVRLVEESKPGGAAGAESGEWRAVGRLLQLLGNGVGELSLVPLSDGLVDLRHREDAGRSDLTLVSPSDLAAWTGRTADGQHRPLRTGRSLPRGWHSAVRADELRGALHAIYPGVLEEAWAYACGTLPVTPWKDTAARQSGIYARVRRASAAQVERATQQTCSGCLRTPLWAGEQMTAPFPAALPCPEACTLLVAAVPQQMKREELEPKQTEHEQIGEVAHA